MAQRYYEHGPPFLHGHAPFWIASFLGEIGIVGLALVAIGIPVLSFVPKARIFYSRMCIEEIYLELRQLDQDMRKATTLQALERVMEKLDSFEMMALRLWTPVGTHDYFYKLRLDIDIVRKQTSQRIQHLSLDPRETGPVAPSA